MPLVITDNLKNSLSRPTPVYKKTIELYRQVWGGSSYTYDTAIDITEYLTEDSPGTIMWKLDKEDYGVFNLDNVTLTFRNDRNQWKQDNPKGLFPSGKLINQSKIIIKIGAQLSDGTYSTLRSFTGYISGDPDYNPEEKKVSMTLVSAMSIFEKKNAEETSTLVTDELLGENSGTEFTTDNNGVGIIVIVKRGTTLGGATEINPTTDYTASDLNLKSTPLKITLVTALTAGEKLYISYRYWYQDKLLEWLAEQVMTLCGITSYSISPAIFSTNVENSWTRTSQADWELGVLQNIDTNSTSGSFKQKWHLIDDFSDGDYTTNLNWTVQSGSWSALTNNLVASTNGTSKIFSTPGTGAYGTWEFKAQAVSPAYLDVLFVHYTNYYAIYTTRPSYLLRITATGLQLIYSDQYENPTILGSATISVTMSDIITITRTPAGLIIVYVNGVLKISATHTLLTKSSRITLIAGNEPATNCTFGSFWYSHDVDITGHADATPIYISDILDGGASLSSWGSIVATYTLFGGTVLIETYSSGTSDFSSDNDPAGWVALSETGMIISALKRYLKVRITLNKDVYTIDAHPLIDAMVITYYTSTTVIDLVNLTGMTCHQVLDMITEMPAYEMGFKADDTFIYRSRSTSAPSILDLTSDTNIKSVRNLSDGVDRVKNRVVANFGIYQKVSDSSADTEPNSITKYGTREYSVSASNLLPAANVNLAYAVAPTILAYTKTPRRRCTVETKFILHLELGDKVTVYYDEPMALRRWKWGDRDISYGQADLEYYNESTLLTRYNLWGVVMRVEGVEFDFQGWTTSFDLVEVI